MFGDKNCVNSNFTHLTCENESGSFKGASGFMYIPPCNFAEIVNNEKKPGFLCFDSTENCYIMINDIKFLKRNCLLYLLNYH